MTHTKKLLSIAGLFAVATLLFAQSDPTRYRAVLIKAINKLDVPFEIDLISGQTTPPINVKNSSGASIYKVDYTGITTSTGGLVQTSATKATHFYTCFAPPATTTTGTDTAAVNGTFWIGEVFVPANATVTGASYLLGSVGGTDKVVVALWSSAGALLANSAVDSSVTAGTTATFQRVPFTATYAATGPAKYFIGVQFNGSTAKLRTQAFGDCDSTSIAQTFNTPVAITVPTTFTASKAPIAMLY